MCLITVAKIASPQGIVEMRCALVGIVSTGVEIVEFESDTETLIDIDGEDSLKPVLSVCPVTTCVVAEVCYRRVCVGEMEIGWLYNYLVIMVRKGELGVLFSVCENPVLSRRSVVAKCVILTIDA